MKFFDPKKKEPSVPENPRTNPTSANVQNANPTPRSQPVPPPPAPIPEPPKMESFKPEAVNMEQKLDSVKQQSASPTVLVPVPEPVRVARSGKTLIGNTVTIRGDITSEENLQIEGVVDGSIESSGDIHVGSEGKVNASLRAMNIVIHGKVIGDCTAVNKLELAHSSLLQGNIRAPRLSIAETAQFSGAIDMRPRETPVVRESKEKKDSMAPLEIVEK